MNEDGEALLVAPRHRSRFSSFSFLYVLVFLAWQSLALVLV